MKLYEVFKPMAVAIAEVLQPSEYRQVVKGWNKERWAGLFKGKYRLYFPLESSTSNIIPNKQVVDFLDSNGFAVKDYANNLAIDTKGREKRIGSIIAKNPTIKKLYDNDPARQGSKVKSHQIVVISRHPYDIAAMSTDRGWTSCMNIRDGENKHYIPIEIEAGTIIAYLIDKNDKNINDASARVLIKPFISVNANEYARVHSDDDILLGINKSVYGNASPEFLTTVKTWVNSVNKSRVMNGVFILHPGVYWDDKDEGRPEPVRYRDGEKVKAPNPHIGDIYIGIYDAYKLYITPKRYEKELDFTNAQKYINELNINGNSGYTMPTSDEMQFIYDNKDKIPESEQLEENYYYTIDDEGSANTFNFGWGDIYDYVQTYKEFYVRGVRKISLNRDIFENGIRRAKFK
jgi:hypothetical protein